MAKKKDESKVTGIVYFCDVLKKKIVSKDLESISAFSQECDICGSHGSISFYVKCKCGEWHDMEFKSW